MPTKKKTQPAKEVAVFIPEKIAPFVHVLRHEKIILDSDLAGLYGVTTGRLNEAVKRNLERFPADFMFQLTENESNALRLQIVTLKNSQGNQDPLISQNAISNPPSSTSPSCAPSCNSAA